MKQARTPLVLLIGFLGSGKTTLLEKLLPVLGGMGRRPHVILNDYKNADVDSARLAALTDLVEPIHGSCVCCDSRDELFDALERVPEEEGTMVLVEANGTTDALELVELLAMDRRAGRFSPPVQVSTVDANRWQRRLWHNRLERSQLVTAGLAWVTRVDEVKPERRDQVVAALEKMGAEIYHGEVAPLAERLGSMDAPRAVVESHGDDCECCGGHGHGHHHHSDHHFASAERSLPPVVDRDALVSLVAEMPDEVVRVKGVCFFEDGGAPHLFQRVEGERKPTVIPLEVQPQTGPVMVLIGARLPMEEIDAQLATLAAVEAAD
ncbi:GTP-binding protein [Sulfuriroseicoccus oceanibius]|uniref:GTP-binding protein n=1 Tax=Sulfuriroseicoccus oceanibius TaxID=2707525 RepID=A0A6B3LDI1_9BACT|nr:GTP-binding protein [Sulfuriroseicoccus oceanibius]QQL45119.1 GTP-binding protein [Sulfuriroseicoccus oceanibius]